jgi:hypothetical protein
MRVYSFTLTSALKHKSDLVNNPGYEYLIE